jgi:hypothetical protein
MPEPTVTRDRLGYHPIQRYQPAPRSASPLEYPFMRAGRARNPDRETGRTGVTKDEAARLPSSYSKTGKLETSCDTSTNSS